MVNAVSVPSIVIPIVSPAIAASTADRTPAQAPAKMLVRSETGGGPGKGQITSTPQFVQFMIKNPGPRQVSYGDFAKSIRSAGGRPPPAYPGGAYFRVVGGSDAGKIVDISKEKYLGKFMSKPMKIDMMEYGFGRLGLKKMGGVTFDEFAKAHTAYLKSAASGSNTEEMRVDRTAYEALGEKAFPNGPPGKKGAGKGASTPPPTKLEDLHPWLQGEVRSGRMTLKRAIEITEAEAERRRTMPDGTPPGYSGPGGQTCVTRASILDRRDFLSPSGEHQIATQAYANTEGQSARTGENQSRSTTRITILHPQTRLPIVVENGGYGVHADSLIEQPRGRAIPLRNPPVIAEGRCYFNDGTEMPSTQGPLMNTERPNPDPALRPGWVRRR